MATEGVNDAVDAGAGRRPLEDADAAAVVGPVPGVNGVVRDVVVVGMFADMCLFIFGGG